MKLLPSIPSIASLFLGGLAVHAQDRNATKVTPSIIFATGPEALRSNLGVQEIVEVLRSPGTANAPEGVGEASEPSSSPTKLQVSANAGIRAYRTSNVLRVDSGTSGSGVMEFSAGVSVGSDPFTVFGREVTPTLLFMNQRAYYGQFAVRGDDLEKNEDGLKGLLDYEFRMLNLGGAFALNEDWRANAAFGYDELRSFRTGQKKYHAFSPIFSISKMKPLTETSMFAVDANLRYALTKTISEYEIPGVFEDDGDNWQAGLNLTYARALGPDGRLLVLPSLGFTSTSYLNNTHSGRVDYLLTAGVSAMYSLTEYISLQGFMTYGTKSANEKGRSLLGTSSKYQNLDVGVAITGQYAF